MFWNIRNNITLLSVILLCSVVMWSECFRDLHSLLLSILHHETSTFFRQCDSVSTVQLIFREVITRTFHAVFRGTMIDGIQSGCVPKEQNKKLDSNMWNAKVHNSSELCKIVRLLHFFTGFFLETLKVPTEGQPKDPKVLYLTLFFFFLNVVWTEGNWKMINSATELWIIIISPPTHTKNQWKLTFYYFLKHYAFLWNIFQWVWIFHCRWVMGWRWAPHLLHFELKGHILFTRPCFSAK